MATQKKQMISTTRSKGRKRRRITSKSGIAVRMVPHRKRERGNFNVIGSNFGTSEINRAKITAFSRKLSQTASFKKAVERSIATAKKNGKPIAMYDVQRGQAYLEYPDGKRAYVE